MTAGRRDPIVVERLLPAPPEDVFAAWSDPESLSTWLCPGDMERATVEVDFRVGGAFRVVMHGAERDYAQHGEYLEIDAPKRLVFTWVSDWVAPEEARTVVTVSLEPADRDRTRLLLVHEELPDTGTYDGHAQGWTSIVDKLAARLASRED